MKTAIILISALLFSLKTFATEQMPEVLIYQGDKLYIVDTLPLAQYDGIASLIDTVKATEGFNLTLNTGCWRGFIGEWTIIDKQLYLTAIHDCNYGSSYVKTKYKADLSALFGKKCINGRVKADWFTGQIVAPQGAEIMYNMQERELYFTFKSGNLVASKTIEYVEKDASRLFPGEKFLKDTLKSIILRHISPKARRDSIDENFHNWLYVTFNQEGEISHIRFDANTPIRKGNMSNMEPYTFMMERQKAMDAERSERVILRSAKQTLKGLPKLMNVKYKDAFPISISIWFSGHCLKYPHDRQYGCKDE